MSHLFAAFVSGFLVDILATLVFHYTAINKAYHAATFNVLVNGCILFVFVDVSSNHTLAYPYLIGLWIGGVVGVEVKKRLEKGVSNGSDSYVGKNREGTTGESTKATTEEQRLEGIKEVSGHSIESNVEIQHKKDTRPSA